MTERIKRLINRKNKRDVMTFIWNSVGSLLDVNECIVIEVRKIKRSDEQNSKLHAMLGDIAKQKTFSGKQRSIEEWKAIFVSGHAMATNRDVEMVIGLEGEVINLRESTAKMSVSRANSLIEYISAWAADNDVKFMEHRKFAGWIK